MTTPAPPSGRRTRVSGAGSAAAACTPGRPRAEETGGAFLLFEDAMDAGKVTPLHIHPDSDETLYVLEGEILMHIDGDEHALAAGGIAVVPRGRAARLHGASPTAGEDAVPADARQRRGVLPARQRAGR